MAYTEKGAAARKIPPNLDRVVTRWKKPPELADGWRRGAVISIAPSNLGPGYPEKPVRGGEVAWFPATNPGWALRFDVLLGAPDRGGLTVNQCAGEVGGMVLSSGAAVWIVATECRTPPEYEAGLAELRRHTRGDDPASRGWAWGTDETGAPALIDLSNLGPE